MRFLIIFISIIALQACSTPKVEHRHYTPPPTNRIIDPPDTALAPSMRDVLKRQNQPLSTTYDFHRYDLDNDGRRDALVLIKTPFGYWCNLNGCPLLVMKANNTGFNLVSVTKPVRAPLTISTNKTKGWNDLIVRVSGRENRLKDVALKFDGNAYPINPEILPRYATLARHHGIETFYHY